MDLEIFDILSEKIEYYPENKTLQLISSIDEEKSDSDIKNLKNRVSSDKWTYTFGYIWYENSNFYISQNEPVHHNTLYKKKNKEIPWELKLKSGSNISELKSLIQGKEKRRLIPLIYRKNKHKIYSIATYRELLNSNNFKFGLEKYFYLSAIGKLKVSIDTEGVLDEEGLYDNIDSYLDGLAIRKKGLKNKINFINIHEIITITDIISNLPNKNIEDTYFKKLTKIIDNDIKEYFKILREDPPKENISKFRISSLPPFMEVSKKNNPLLGNLCNTLEYTEKIISNSNIEIVRDRNQIDILTSLSNFIKNISPLITPFSLIIIFYFLISETNFKLIFLTNILNNINLSTLTPLIAFSGIIISIYIMLAFIALQVLEKSADTSLFLIRKFIHPKAKRKHIGYTSIVLFIMDFLCILFLQKEFGSILYIILFIILILTLFSPLIFFANVGPIESIRRNSELKKISLHS